MVGKAISQYFPLYKKRGMWYNEKKDEKGRGTK